MHSYNDIISIENLLLAWKEFVRGKRKKHDVQVFQLDLMYHILALHEELKAGTYRHGGYHAFKISDPKPRDIHKASVRDRLVHHAVYRVLYPFYDRTFIADSYSCRKEKGTHKAIDRLQAFVWKVTRNNTRAAWVLKCDVRKFFANIDHDILMRLLRVRIADGRIVSLLQEIVGSFSSADGKGLPLGNLTSQLLVNIYMNEFDQFAKHKLKARHYIRYADDFVFLSDDRDWLVRALLRVGQFLKDELGLVLHPGKISNGTTAAGVDFLGWVHFPDHRVLRTSTKRRAMKSMVASAGTKEVVQSYLGLMRHGNCRKLERIVMNGAVGAAGVG